VDDLYFAQGYITARERMFQMDMTRRAGRGELSVLFGDVTLDTDKFLKTAGFYRTAVMEYHTLSDEARAAIEAYTDGVNAYIRTTRRIPREYVILGADVEPWLPEDTVVCGVLMAYSLTRSKKADLVLFRIGEIAGEEVLAELIPSYPEGYPTVSRADGITPPAKEADYFFTHSEALPNLSDRADGIGDPLSDIAASNWMIFSGAKTEAGKPIFTGSPDLEPQIPSLFYLVHLIGDGVNVMGGAIPGVPGVNVLGFNGRIAWSCVNGRIDELDYFIEKLNPENPNQYLTEDGYRDFEIVEETLKVKADDGIRTETITVKISRHGPMISDVMPLAPENTAMMWVGSGPTGIFDGFLALNRAKNFDEFRRAIGMVKSPTLNIGYADIDGNIGYQYMTSVPIRKKGDGTLPVPGWNGEYDWTGFFPFEELPFDINPEKGYVASFNNPAYDTPYHMTNYFLFERALRFEEIADATDRVTADEARRIQLDTVSMVARRWVPHIMRVAADEEFSALTALLSGWDFSMSSKSPAATLFNSFYFHLMTNTLADEVGQELWKEQLSQAYLIYIPDLLLTKVIDDNEYLLFDDITTPDTRETRDDIIKRSLRNAEMELTERLGDDPTGWEWSKVHRMIFTHPLGKKLGFFNLSPIPTEGDSFTINAGMWESSNPYEMTSGGVIRMVVDFADIEHATIISPPGQSGLYLSPHYDDVAKPWAQGEQIPMHFLDAGELSRVLVLMPSE
jgi:penicillin amidase